MHIILYFITLCQVNKTSEIIVYRIIFGQSFMKNKVSFTVVFPVSGPISMTYIILCIYTRVIQCKYFLALIIFLAFIQFLIFETFKYTYLEIKHYIFNQILNFVYAIIIFCCIDTTSNNLFCFFNFESRFLQHFLDRFTCYIIYKTKLVRV